MHVPSNWSTQKRPKSGRAKPDGARKKARQHFEHQEPQSLQDLALQISASILNSTPSKMDNTLNLHTILSNVPYRDILENLFGSEGAPPAEVLVISKGYEELFLREPMGPNERPCVMGLECEGQMIDKNHRMTLVEFLLPNQPRTEPQMCVLCCRKHTQKLFYDLLYNPPANHMGVIQRYGVVVGTDEYGQDEIGRAHV